MHADMDFAPKGWLNFNDEKLCFNSKEDELLDDDEVVCMVDTKASL